MAVCVHCLRVSYSIRYCVTLSWEIFIFTTLIHTNTLYLPFLRCCVYIWACSMCVELYRNGVYFAFWLESSLSVVAAAAVYRIFQFFLFSSTFSMLCTHSRREEIFPPVCFGFWIYLRVTRWLAVWEAFIGRHHWILESERKNFISEVNLCFSRLHLHAN